MRNTVEEIHSQDRTSNSQEALATQIQKALSNVLKSTPFRASKQAQHLLQFIVDQSLAGHGERLKERVIGAEVFGRPIDYDTNEDPIVRARAAEVRKRLAQYYVGEGNGSLIRIEISPGSYHAAFSDLDKSRAKEPGVGDSEPVPPQTQLRSPVQSENFARPSEPPARGTLVHSTPVIWILGIASLFLVVAVCTYIARPKSLILQFWSPFLDNFKPVLIYTGANPVYMPSTQLIERFKATHHMSELDTGGHEFLIPVTENERLGAADLVEIKNEFVTIGDLSANVSVTSLLTNFKHSFDLRSAEDIAFGDLRESPAVLIGAFNNTWTLQMTGDLPFVFGSGLTIRDQRDKGRQWRPQVSSENKVQVDYALVARLPHSKTGTALITIAGITQSGTRAAAEFITSPQGIKDLLKSAPPSWSSKNLEFVLQTRVVNDIPTTPSVVAVRAW